ncbi:MAG: helix-turn-helix domain-containing protein [Lactobacillales bacterium]|jgi:transcriptional regulator with XRE-family HTH domain|nr:helix-turn-helix domain-containing protein [Lactobacillales bacterium]
MKQNDKSIFQIGARIKARRKAMGLTQEKLAELMDCSFKTISNIENDNTVPDTRQVVNLCDILQMTFEEMFSDVLKKKNVSYPVDPDGTPQPQIGYPFLMERVIVSPVQSRGQIQKFEHIVMRLKNMPEEQLDVVKTVVDYLFRTKK